MLRSAAKGLEARLEARAPAFPTLQERHSSRSTRSSIRGGGDCFPGQGEDLLRKGEALELVAAEAAGGAAPVPGVVSREQQRHREALVQRLDAADQVHRRADHGDRK